MSQLYPAGYQYLDANGDPVGGGTVTFYLNKTTTLANIYNSPNLTPDGANPITLDAAGRIGNSIYGDNGVRLTVLVNDSSGAEVFTRDAAFGWPEAISSSIVYDQGGAGSAERTVESKLNDISVSALDFYDSSGGILNYTLSFQAAINYAATVLYQLPDTGFRVTTAKVIIPPGTFIVDTLTLPSGVILQGSGMSNTVLNHTGGGTNCVEMDVGGGGAQFATQVRDLSIVGAGKLVTDTLAGVSSIDEAAIYNCGVFDCLITQCYDGINIAEAWTFRVEDCMINYVGRNCFRGARVSTARIEGGRFEYAGEDAIRLLDSGGGPSFGVRIGDVIIQFCENRGVYATDIGSIFFSGTYFEGNNQSNGGFAVIERADDIAAISGTYIFSDCLFEDLSSPAVAEAILIDRARYVSVHGSTFLGVYTTAVALGSNVSSFDVSSDFIGPPNEVTHNTNSPGQVISRRGQRLHAIGLLKGRLLNDPGTSNSDDNYAYYNLIPSSGTETLTLLDAQWASGRTLIVTHGGTGGTVTIAGETYTVLGNTSLVPQELTMVVAVQVGGVNRWISK